MISIKTEKEIAIMQVGGKKLKKVFDEVLPTIKPGISKREIDKKAEKMILALGGKPSFKMVPDYDWATCININDEVVHGIPNEDIVQAGDLVSLDIGMYYQGFHTDRAETIKIGIRDTRYEIRDNRHLRGGAPAGDDSSEVNEFLEAGKLALKKAIQVAVPGNRVGHISLAMQKVIEKAGFNMVRSLTGHGIGRKLHEEPTIACFLSNFLKNTSILKTGMGVAIEVIYCADSPELILLPDDWTLATKDGKMSSLFEETVVITNGDPLICNGT